MASLASPAHPNAAASVSSTPTGAAAGGFASAAASPAQSGQPSTLPPPSLVPIASLTPQSSQSGSGSNPTPSSSTSGSTGGGGPSLNPHHTLIHTRTGESIYNSMEKINSELLSMTYGAMVTQLVRDYKDLRVVNAELEKLGYNMGVRLVDEFLAKSNLQSCVNFRETAQVVAKIGLKMFLGITADVTKWREDGRACSLVFKGNPLAEFVELPVELGELEYNLALCGAIRGALHMLQMNVECQVVRDEVKGSPENEIRLILKEILAENYNDEEEH